MPACGPRLCVAVAFDGPGYDGPASLLAPLPPPGLEGPLAWGPGLSSSSHGDEDEDKERGPPEQADAPTAGAELQLEEPELPGAATPLGHERPARVRLGSLELGRCKPTAAEREASPAFVRLVFGESARGVPLLSRGWRTPDPSPTRSAAGLPCCRPAPMFGRRWPGPEQPEDESVTPRQRGRDARPERKMSHTISRTPSPTASPALGSPRKVSCGAPRRPEGRTALGELLLPLGRSAVPPLLPTLLPRGAPGGQDTPPSGSSGAAQSLSPIAHPGFLAWVAPVPLPLYSPEVLGAAHLCAPSFGSVGHPHACAEFCKYAKKPRGCKDGASCDHCHLCTQKRCDGTPPQVAGRRWWRGSSKRAEAQQKSKAK